MSRSNAQATQDFVANPKDFLSSNFVCISGGGGARAAGLTVFTLTRFGTRHGFGTIFHIHKKRTAWQIGISQNQDQNNLGANEFVAYYCPMRTMGTAQVNTSTNLPANPAVHLMITSQLSGCTFAYETLGGGSTNVMHVQPVAPRDQPDRAQARSDVRDTITFNMPWTGIAEKGDKYLEKATIVGWYRGGRWRFYTQLQDVYKTKETAMGMAKI